jgi:acetyl esterase/lipase
MSRTPGWLILWAAILLGSPIVRSAEPLEIPLWPGAAPGSEGITTPEKWENRGANGVVDRAVREIHRPTITVFLPDRAKATGTAALIAPGGGYEHLAIDKEGNDVARWLSAQGIAGIVLKYRLPKTPDADYTTGTALADVAQALKIIRAQAGEWGLDRAKVGMLGFSAGGNLTALAGTKLPADVRPAFLGLMYPAIPPALAPIPADTPRAFIGQADNDPLGTDNSIRFYQWLHADKIPAELHLFSSGGHGFGLGAPGTPPASWPRLFVAWLRANGFGRGK